MMTPYEAFCVYVALKAHFTSSSYDYFRYNGKMRSSKFENYEKRRDKNFFIKLSKHKDPVNFLVANLINYNKYWAGDLVYNSDAQDSYLKWLKRTQSLSYVVKNDLSKLKEDFDSNFRIEKHDYPYIITLYLQKEISLETVVILMDMVRCYSYWNKNINDPFWNDLSLLLRKYKPFIQYDKQKIKEIVLDYFQK
jgi:T4 gene Gp59 loader of gp41 DNA helicase/T4 gene Gp59 loader of gp41 DNA helicase C-term